MRLAAFILANLRPLLENWDDHARSAGVTLDRTALRNHAEQILREVARDMGTTQSPDEQRTKSEGDAPTVTGPTPASIHGTGRFDEGFDLNQLFGEYRALRATVMRQWGQALHPDSRIDPREIVRFNEAIDQAISESVERFTLKHGEAISTFMSTMSHELRSPLNAVIGFTEVVLKGMAGPLNPEQIRQLGMAKSGAYHLLSLINDVLDLSKLAAGQLGANAEAFDVTESVKRVIASVKAVADAKHLSLRCDISPELGDLVSDQRRVEQVLLNLLNNAVKFTDEGGVTLSVQPVADAISSTSALDRSAIRFQVTDTGIGIKPEDMWILFEPFRQVDNGRARHGEGTGLGLVISQRLAKFLGGEIVVESQWRNGSTFTFTLPLTQDGRESQDDPRA
jgi:signal transduction histidine kinase